MVRHGIDIEHLTTAFLDSLYWYRQLLDAIEEEEESEEEGEGEQSLASEA
jgi:hypothetical protein